MITALGSTLVQESVKYPEILTSTCTYNIWSRGSEGYVDNGCTTQHLPSGSLSWRQVSIWSTWRIREDVGRVRGGGACKCQCQYNHMSTTQMGNCQFAQQLFQWYKWCKQVVTVEKAKRNTWQMQMQALCYLISSLILRHYCQHWWFVAQQPKLLSNWGSLNWNDGNKRNSSQIHWFRFYSTHKLHT